MHRVLERARFERTGGHGPPVLSFPVESEHRAGAQGAADRSPSSPRLSAPSMSWDAVSGGRDGDDPALRPGARDHDDETDDVPASVTTEAAAGDAASAQQLLIALEPDPAGDPSS